MTYYPPGVNPGITLYNNWLFLLQAQGPCEPVNREPKWDFNPYPAMAYGHLHTGIGVSTFDKQQRPIIGFGGYWRVNTPVHPYFLVNADGEFRLMWPHGDNHNRIERNTFLGYGYHGGQYVWYVSLTHALVTHTLGQSINTKDWRARIPYLRERVIVPNGWNDPHRHNKWLFVHQDDDGRWHMSPAPDTNGDWQDMVAEDKARVERAYRKFQRKDIGTRTLSLRDGTKTLTQDAAVLHIAALLDVSRPAKAVPMSKTPKEVTV